MYRKGDLKPKYTNIELAIVITLFDATNHFSNIETLPIEATALDSSTAIWLFKPNRVCANRNKFPII